jgi:hypothetical protein
VSPDRARIKDDTGEQALSANHLSSTRQETPASARTGRGTSSPPARTRSPLVLIGVAALQRTIGNQAVGELLRRRGPATPAASALPQQSKAGQAVGDVAKLALQQTLGNRTVSRSRPANPATSTMSRVAIQRESVADTQRKLEVLDIEHSLDHRAQLLKTLREYEALVMLPDLAGAYRAHLRAKSDIEGFMRGLESGRGVRGEQGKAEALESLRQWLIQIAQNTTQESKQELIARDRRDGRLLYKQPALRLSEADGPSPGPVPREADKRAGLSPSRHRR